MLSSDSIIKLRNISSLAHLKKRRKPISLLKSKTMKIIKKRLNDLRTHADPLW